MKKVFLLVSFLLMSTLSFSSLAKFNEVTGFNNPGSLDMYKYVPANLNKRAPIVVVLHGCQQKALSFAQNSGWVTFADQLGFVLLLPEQASGNNFARCFNWFQKDDVTKGQGEVASIANGIDKLKEEKGLDKSDVFITGISAGASLASALLAIYPKKFKAGALVAGVPYGCADRVSQSFSCMLSPASKTAEELGDDVRKVAGQNQGSFPIISVVHGLRDSVVKIANAHHSISQWTNVHGIDQKVDQHREIAGTKFRLDQHTKNGKVLVELLEVEGAAHGWPIAAAKGCGKDGNFIIDNGLCVTKEFLKSWGVLK
jgi:poly(hydroxyalkanoate) depolymerase family esterase